MRTRDKYKIIEVSVKDIQPEIVPLQQEKSLKVSLFYDEEPTQHEEVRLVELTEGPYKYRVINGRRRVETYRAENENAKVRAIVLKDLSEDEIRWGALIANAGTANYADEAEHLAYLREKGWKQEELAKKTGYSIGTINGRLRLFDDLSTISFNLLKDGSINKTCAWELTKLSKEDQDSFINKTMDNGKRLTPKLVKEFYRQKQAEQIEVQPELFGEFEMIGEEDMPNGLFLTHEQMVTLLKGDFIRFEYMGEIVEVIKTNQGFE